LALFQRSEAILSSAREPVEDWLPTGTLKTKLTIPSHKTGRNTPGQYRGRGNKVSRTKTEGGRRMKEERIKKIIEQVEKNKKNWQKNKSLEHRFMWGIYCYFYDDDKDSGLRARTAKKLYNLLYQRRPEWIYWSSELSLTGREGNFFIDDGCMRGVFHPKTPIEVALATELLEEEDFLLYVIAVLEEKIELSGEKVGQSPENTCPKCKGFLKSGATRETLYYWCTSCDYEYKIEV